MSRTGLGEAIGVSKETIGFWERGEFTREPARALLEAIARETKVPATFERVVVAKPSVTERARTAAQRLAGTPDASSETPDVRDAEGGES